MNAPPASPADESQVADAAAPAFGRLAVGLLLLAAGGVPLSLLWDFSWESTVGIDRVWAPAHTASYLAVALAGVTALGLALTNTGATTRKIAGVRLGRFEAPLGAWLAAWGALAFLAAFLFDRWWQSAYGLAAGIWHPPQILKAVAFFAVVVGAWLVGLPGQNQSASARGAGGAWAFAVGGGFVLALISVVSLTSIYPNRQHSASFYKLACGTYPLVLVALATAGRFRWTATWASLVYTGVMGLMVWVLPLWPAQPLVAPIYNSLDHLMPPPFPLLLIVPALALDALARLFPWPVNRARPWLQAGAMGLGFFFVFAMTQWIFAEFLLSDLAENWFFAGGGKHWPFFLKIEAAARVAFWASPQDEFNLLNALAAAGLSILAAGLGWWLGAWLTRLRR